MAARPAGLAGFTNELRYVDNAHQTLAELQPMMTQYPLGFGQWLQPVAFALSQPRVIAIVGDPDSVDTEALLSVVGDSCRPFQVVAPGAPSPEGGEVPLLEDRGLVEGLATAYECRTIHRVEATVLA